MAGKPKVLPEIEWTFPDLTPLPLSLPVVPGESARSYVARSAKQLGVRQTDFLRRLGVGSQTDLAAFGYAHTQRDDALSQILRLNQTDFASLNWIVDEDDYRMPRKVAIPTRTRLCPHCLAEYNAWQKHWVDPLTFICERHGTLLLHVDPTTTLPFKTFQVPQFNHTQLAEMRASTGEPVPEFIETQETLNSLRHGWTEAKPLQYGSGKYYAETIILEALTMTRHTHANNPKSPAVERWLQPWADQLAAAGRPLTNEPDPIPDVNTLHAPTEHIAALAPALVTVLTEGHDDGRETLDDMLDQMFLEHRTHTWAARRTLYQWAGGRFAA